MVERSLRSTARHLRVLQLFGAEITGNVVLRGSHDRGKARKASAWATDLQQPDKGGNAGSARLRPKRTAHR